MACPSRDTNKLELNSMRKEAKSKQTDEEE